MGGPTIEFIAECAVRSWGLVGSLWMRPGRTCSISSQIPLPLTRFLTTKMQTLPSARPMVFLPWSKLRTDWLLFKSGGCWEFCPSDEKGTNLKLLKHSTLSQPCICERLDFPQGLRPKQHGSWFNARADIATRPSSGCQELEIYKNIKYYHPFCDLIWFCEICLFTKRAYLCLGIYS